MPHQKSLATFSAFAREKLFQNLHPQLLSVEKSHTPTSVDQRLLELGPEAALEEACYTWFNRLVVLRYFELHRIFPDQDPNLWHSPINLLSSCRLARTFLPQLFAEQTTYCDDLTLNFCFEKNGVIERLLALPPEAFLETEVLGWFYQFYNSTRRQAVVSAKKPYSKLEIPVATQLFTPSWISQFLVENSLGHFYLKNGGDETLAKDWQFYHPSIDDKKNRQTNPNSLTDSENNPLQKTYPLKINLEKITFLDPCCGSGHLLACAFRLFYQMYLAAGFSPSEIPSQILTYNLFGLDIDARAVQIATVVILLCAYEYDSEIFQKPIACNLHICEIPESNSVGKVYVDSIKSSSIRKLAEDLFEFFVEAKNFGSLLSPEPKNFSELIQYLADDNSAKTKRSAQNLLPMIQAYEMLTRRYDIVATNPPYLASSAMNELLKDYVAENFADYKKDLSTAFIMRCLAFLRDKNSLFAAMTPATWLFTIKFQPFRQYILQNNCIKVLIQPYKHAFFEYAAVEICAFVLENHLSSSSEFLRINQNGNMSSQAKSFLNGDFEVFYHDQAKFLQLPDQRILYWLDERMLELFSTTSPLATFANLKPGIITSENQQFLRRWYEVAPRQFKKKWLPHNKGGSYRKWYGNQDYVINWSKTVAELKKRKRSKDRNARPQNLEYNFRPHLSWSAICDGDFSVRFYDESFSFNSAAPGCFPAHENDEKYLLGFLNSCVAEKIVSALNPTLNFNPGDLAKLPIIIDEKSRTRVTELVSQNLDLAKVDYDSFETSWSFKFHPLIKYSDTPTVADAFKKWQTETQQRFYQLQQNEIELNQIFIKLYGLRDVFNSSVPDEKISLQLARCRRDVESLLSFFVGYVFGRFDLPGEPTKRSKVLVLTIENLYPKLKTFLNLCFERTELNNNLTFIADALGREIGENNEATILRYFREKFFAHHLRAYHNLPIYWQVDSGPEHAFRAWFYCHNHQARTLTELQRQVSSSLKNYSSKLNELNQQLENATSKGDQKWLTARKKRLVAKLEELESFATRVAALHAEKPKLNFDQGIQPNYQKMSSVLSPLPKS